MNAFAYSSLITIVVTVFLGFFVFLGNRKKRINQLWFVVSIFIAFWIVGLFGSVVSSNPNQALFWQRLLYIGTALIPASFFHYTTSLIGKEKKFRWQILELYFVSIIFAVFSFSSYFIVKVVQRTYFDYWPVETGSMYPVFLFYFSISTFYTLRLIYIEYRNTYGLRSKQMLYMLVASLIGFIGGSTNFVLDFRLNIYPIGNFFVAFYAFIMAYSIIKHRLMDIRFVISRSIIYLFLVIFVASMFTGITFLTTSLFQAVLGANKFLLTLLASIIIVLFLDPIKHWLSRTTDSVFFKAKIEYPILLRDLSEIISTEIEIDTLIENLTKKLDAGLKVKNSILVLQSKDGAFRVRTLGHPHTEPLVFEQNNPLIKYLNKVDKTIIAEELQRKIEDTSDEKGKAELEKSMAELEKIQAAAIAPVKTKEKLNAVLLLGPKLSGDVFTKESIDLIEVLTPQIASAIEKSKLFEEVKGFSDTLQKKVDDATGELSERNKFLLALQKVTNVITRSLDLNKAAQSIVNSIQKDLGYVGGLLLLIDKEKDRIYPAAITQSKLTEKTLKLLPKPIYEYYSVYSEDTTIDAMAAKEQKIKIGKGFEDFVSPPIPKIVCQGIDKLLKVKSLVAVPIFSENEVIGIIDFILQKPGEEISEREIDLMKSLADQTGIVYRNLKLFEQIKKANEELGEANVRLKALDQAKTEFVSIASHQLRTPMTGIMGYLSMLTSGDFGKLKPEHLKILKELLDESQRMIRLINQFLNVSKIEAGKFELSKREVQLEEVITEKIKEIRQAAEKKNLELIYNPPKKKLAAVNADPDKLSDIILNLIDNAIKYTNKGSVTVSIVQKDSEIQVAIKDTGVGINKQDAKELFGKFQRGTGIARIQPDGSGLGLFIAKSVVEGHHGRIWAESAGEGKGSTFFFTIPIKK